MRKQEGKRGSHHTERRVIPIEEALMALIGIRIPESETEKGIPFVSFVIKKGEGAVFIKPFPLPVADRSLKEQIVAGSEVLYRADYRRGGAKKISIGILFAEETPEFFLETLESNIRSGNAKADIMGIRSYLEAHLALCGLERLAWEEIEFMGKEEAGAEERRKADSSYYREILAYVEKGRRYLNENIGASGISPPLFPQRSVFMDKWHRKHKGSRKDTRKTAQKMEGD